MSESSGKLTADDRAEITELFAKYAWAGDTGDVDAYVSLFTEDGLFDGGPSFTIAMGFDPPAERMLYVAIGDTIVKVRYSDRMEVNRHTVDGLVLQTPQLRVDSAGRLWQGTEDGLVVFDTAGFNGFTEVARVICFRKDL